MKTAETTEETLVHGSILTTKPLCGVIGRYSTTDPAKVTCGGCIAAWWARKGRESRGIVDGQLHVLTMDPVTGATVLSPLGPVTGFGSTPDRPHTRGGDETTNKGIVPRPTARQEQVEPVPFARLKDIVVRWSYAGADYQISGRQLQGLLRCLGTQLIGSRRRAAMSEAIVWIGMDK
jgi:hypothetical protein